VARLRRTTVRAPYGETGLPHCCGARFHFALAQAFQVDDAQVTVFDADAAAPLQPVSPSRSISRTPMDWPSRSGRRLLAVAPRRRRRRRSCCSSFTGRGARRTSRCVRAGPGADDRCDAPRIVAAPRVEDEVQHIGAAEDLLFITRGEPQAGGDQRLRWQGRRAAHSRGQPFLASTPSTKSTS